MKEKCKLLQERYHPLVYTPDEKPTCWLYKCKLKFGYGLYKPKYNILRTNFHSNSPWQNDKQQYFKILFWNPNPTVLCKWQNWAESNKAPSIQNNVFTQNKN